MDLSGRPMGGVRVSVWRWNYHEGRKELGEVTLDGPVTESDGNFRVGNLDPGNYVLRAENP